MVEAGSRELLQCCGLNSASSKLSYDLNPTAVYKTGHQPHKLLLCSFIWHKGTFLPFPFINVLLKACVELLYLACNAKSHWLGGSFNLKHEAEISVDLNVKNI